MIRALAFVVALATAALAAAQEAATRTVEVAIVYAAAGGYYLDGGTERSLRPGLEGVVRGDGGVIGTVRIRSASRTSAFVTVVRRTGPRAPRVGDAVAFAVPTTDPPGEPVESDAPFTPLLAPAPSTAIAETRNVFHGDLRVGIAWTNDRESGRDYLYPQLASSGSGERIGGGPWSLEWDVVLNTRLGDGYDDRDDYRDVRLRVDQLVVRRHFADDSVAGVGRIQPLALPGIGLFDGVYGEWNASDSVRVGGIGGLRPDPEDLGLSGDAPGVAGWCAIDLGSPDAVRFFTAFGALATWFDGSPDRHAAFVDARLVSAAGWRLDITSEIDLYRGDDDESGLALTRFGGRFDVPLGAVFGVWFDVQHFQLPDTLAARSTFDLDESLYTYGEVFNNGYRRTSVGLRQNVGRGWYFEEEATIVVAEDIDDELQVRLTVRKNAPFGWRGTAADATAFNVVGVDLDGFGGRIGFGGMVAETLYARVGYAFTRVESTLPGHDPLTNHFPSIDFDWRVSIPWSIHFRLGTAFGDGARSTTVDAGVTWRF